VYKRQLYYFGITTTMIFGIGFSGIIDRQRMVHQRREHHSQNEIQRLAKEAERERIGQDLHDVIGHSLTSIHLKAQLATKRLTHGEFDEARAQCEAIANLASDALKEIRETLADIKRQSLAEELRAQQQSLAQLGIEFNFSLPQEMLIPTLESDLLLISRELITNTLRHAQATQIQLTLSFTQATLSIHYHDNGHGMSSTDEQVFGNGLQGIRHRVQRRQGSFALRNDRGLNIDITLPRTALEQS
jgi:two-component system sensor histidine kinase DesK